MSPDRIKRSAKAESRALRGLCQRCARPARHSKLCAIHADENRRDAADRYSALRRSATCCVAGCNEKVPRAEQLTFWGAPIVVSPARCAEHERYHRLVNLMRSGDPEPTQGVLL